MTRHGNDEKNGKNDNAGSRPHNSPASHESHSPPDPPPDLLLPPRGDYQTLLSFQKAEVIYDITFRFAHKFLARSDRTIDQMIQSARSGKKNILEGSKAGLTSKETEIKLTPPIPIPPSRRGRPATKTRRALEASHEPPAPPCRPTPTPKSQSCRPPSVASFP